MASQYATVDAWMAYLRHSGGNADEATMLKYAQAYASAGQAPPDAGKSAIDENNAYRTIYDVFDSYGLGSLAPQILRLIQQGYDTEAEIDLMLRDTKEYKERFAANEARKKAGLTTLSPAEYIATERQYAQTMRAAGLPAGFYDSPEDFRGLLERDVSVNEVNQRVAVARRAVLDAPQETRDALTEFYGIGPGELTAFFLDPEKGMAVVQRAADAAAIGGARKTAGLGADRGSAERLASLGVTDQQAREGYSQIADLLPDAERLSNIYTDQGKYDLKAAEAEVFGDTGAAGASKTRKNLASSERAAFSGASGTAGADSLSVRRKGRI